jgi:hypothetical protein
LLIAAIFADYSPVVPIVAVAAALVLVSGAATPPENARRFFPLEPRSVWTFEDTRYGGTSSMTVTRARDGVFDLERFPGARNLRVRWSGRTLQAWDAAQRRWEALLPLGAKTGTGSRVDLPPPPWNDARITVASRQATVRSGRRAYRGTIRLDVRPPPELSDGGILGLWFAPRVGLVRWVEQTIAGPVAHVLVSPRRM